jgi:hypothetical protein
MSTTTRPDLNDFDLAPAESEEDFPLVDFGGYLACGCHGSQQEHTCVPSEWDPEE